jgi:hypothetical protein
MDEDKLLTFDSAEMLKDVRAAVQEEQLFANLKAHSEVMDNEKDEDEKLQFDDFQEFNSIFDRIADLDKMLSDDEDDDDFGLDRAIGSIDVEYTESDDQKKSSNADVGGFTQSIDEIMNDFPGVVVKPNNFMLDLDFDQEKDYQQQQEPEEILLVTPR